MIIKIITYIFLVITLTDLDGQTLTQREAMRMVGYNNDEISDIDSGRRTRLQVDRQNRQKMLGFTKREIYQTDKIDKTDRLFNTFPINSSKKVHPLIKAAIPYYDIVKDASIKSRLKDSLILALIKVESDFNHRAVSPKGAMGLMQLMPDTAVFLGVKNAFDPVQNIDGGTRYLLYCLKKYNDLTLALAAYNAGPNKVLKLNQAEIKEVQGYINKIRYFEKTYNSLLIGGWSCIKLLKGCQ